MAPRRSFLGVLIALWPFERAVADSQKKGGKLEETPCRPEDGEEVKKKALQECKDEVKKGCEWDGGNVSDDALNILEQRCRGDFTKQLCHKNDKEKGKKCWDKDGAKVRNVANLVGMSARLAAKAEGTPSITATHLVAALKFVNQFCQAEACGDQKGLRGGDQKILRAYCANAAKD